MSEHSYSMDQCRTDFGKHLKRLRTRRKLTQTHFKAVCGVPASLVSAYEHGERSVGPEVAEKLADGLQLQADERERFLIGAAKTRRKDRLIGEARHLPPEVLNYVPKFLTNLGIESAKITGADYLQAGEVPNPCITMCLDEEYARLKRAVMSVDPYDLLRVTADGKRYVCALLVAPEP